MRNLWYALLTALALNLAAGIGLADSRDAGRLAMGLKLFRATLAADLALRDKVSADGSLQLLVVSGGDAVQAQQVADKLTAGSPIRDLPVRAVVVDDPQSIPENGQACAGVFIARPGLPEAELKRWVAFGRAHPVIIYSPFEGDVEQGVTAGLFITARVQPYVNMKTLEESGIRMKAFFLKVAKAYR